MQFVNIGFGNLVSADRLIALVSPDSAPVKRLVQEARDRGMLIDATFGRKTASVLVMDSVSEVAYLFTREGRRGFSAPPTPVPCSVERGGGSQARGHLGAAAAGPYHSHSHLDPSRI